ncbi:MAG: S9 family peptidase [Gemmatimonadota bacterium]
MWYTDAGGQVGGRVRGGFGATLRLLAAFVLAAGLFLVTVPMGVVAQTATQNLPGLSAQDLHQLRSVGDVALSPDGRWVTYTVVNRERPGRPHSQVWVRELASGEDRLLVGKGESSSAPLWAPDGQWIAYRGVLDGRSGIVVRRPDGSDPRFVAETTGTNHPLPGTGGSLTWAPDSRRLAFLSATPGPEPDEASADGDPVVIRRYLYHTTGSDGVSYFNDNRRLHIFVGDIDGSTPRQLTRGAGYHHSIHWSPVADEILFVTNPEPDPDRFFNYDIFTVQVADGAVRRLTHTESVLYRPRWSPDGRQIAYQGTTRGLTSSETTMEDTHIWVMDADGSNRREVGGDMDNRQGAPDWSADGRHVYFTVQERGSIRLYRVTATGDAPEDVVRERGRVGNWSLGPGGEVAFAFHGPSDLAQLHLRDTTGASRALTELNRELLSARAATEIHAFTVVAFDGLEVEAFLTLPHGMREGSRHPLIVMIKGGPHSQQGPILDPRAQTFASEGWGALMVNYRGSTGYGQAFTDAIFGDQNGREAMDVLQAVEAATRRFPWIDPQRIGVEGGSYGGQLTNWLVTQTDRFAAAIPRAGIANLISFNYLSYYHDYLAVEYGGFPHQGDIMDQLWERSPLRHVAKVRTPVMLVHGMNDHNVPRAEAEQFYIALHDVGVETELVLYPRAGHGIAETGQLVDFGERSIDWYRRHFQGR